MNTPVTVSYPKTLNGWIRLSEGKRLALGVSLYRLNHWFDHGFAYVDKKGKILALNVQWVMVEDSTGIPNIIAGPSPSTGIVPVIKNQRIPGVRKRLLGYVGKSFHLLKKQTDWKKWIDMDKV